jgi:hypothetical protein
MERADERTQREHKKDHDRGAMEAEVEARWVFSYSVRFVHCPRLNRAFLGRSRERVVIRDKEISEVTRSRVKRARAQSPPRE